MGYLLGSYGKQIAGSIVRGIQAKKMRIQQQLRHATRTVEQRTKYWDNVLKNLKQSSMAQVNSAMAGLQEGLSSSIFSGMQIKDKNGNDVNMTNVMNMDWNNLDGSTVQQLSSRMTAANQQNALRVQAMQSALQQTLAMQEQSVEMQRDAEIQPLKDYEESLHVENEALDGRLKLAEQDYEACKKMEEAGVKSLAPSYTGQG